MSKDGYLADHAEAIRKFADEEEDPPGCLFCGAMAGACAEYPRCPNGAQELQRRLDEIADIPVEVIEAAHNCENAGGDAQLLAEFVIELAVRT